MSTQVTPVPDTHTPLVRPPVQPVEYSNLGDLVWLLGTWNSPRGAEATGYNVMPLPQEGAMHGFVMKNFPYYEEITFAPIAGGATNRGGTFAQNNAVLLYEQRVFFADNPAPADAPSVQDKLTHAENGAWLLRTNGKQKDGPYGPGTLPFTPPSQNPALQYCKQVSVPHGNSVLMVGHATHATGQPKIPSTPTTIPPFNDPSVTDPNTYLTSQLNNLNNQKVSVERYIQIDVSSSPAVGGGISNVLFEQQHATVDDMQTRWYIEFLSNGQVQLQYYQYIYMKLLIGDHLVPFLHADANTLLPAGGQMPQA